MELLPKLFTHSFILPGWEVVHGYQRLDGGNAGWTDQELDPDPSGANQTRGNQPECHWTSEGIFTMNIWDAFLPMRARSSNLEIVDSDIKC